MCQKPYCLSEALRHPRTHWMKNLKTTIYWQTDMSAVHDQDAGYQTCNFSCLSSATAWGLQSSGFGWKWKGASFNGRKSHWGHRVQMGFIALFVHPAPLTLKRRKLLGCAPRSPDLALVTFIQPLQYFEAWPGNDRPNVRPKHRDLMLPAEKWQGHRISLYCALINQLPHLRARTCTDMHINILPPFLLPSHHHS